MVQATAPCRRGDQQPRVDVRHLSEHQHAWLDGRHGKAFELKSPHTAPACGELQRVEDLPPFNGVRRPLHVLRRHGLGRRVAPRGADVRQDGRRGRARGMEAVHGRRPGGNRHQQHGRDGGDEDQQTSTAPSGGCTTACAFHGASFPRSSSCATAAKTHRRRRV